MTVPGCAFLDPFSNYRGVNLFASGTLADWTPDSGTYLGYGSVGGETPPVASAPVYRLELLNLIPNGDFDTGSIVPWVHVPGGGGGDVIGVLSSPPGEIDGNTLEILTDDTTDRLEYDLTTALDGLVAGATYSVRFDYRTESSALIFEYRDNGVCPSATCRTWLGGGGVGGSTAAALLSRRIAFPPLQLMALGAHSASTEFIAGSPTPLLSFNSIDAASAITITAPNQYIDNIRLMRTDLELRLRLTLPITGTTDQDLIPGNYRFSIWVKRDPNLGNNRFAANEVSLFARTATQFFQTVRSDATGWANWTSLSLDIPVAVLDAANPALELAIASTDRITANSSAAGSVLISAPSLQLCPSGFAAADCT